MKQTRIVDPFDLKKTEEFLGFRLTSFELDVARNCEGHVRVQRGERIYNLKLNTILFKDLFSEELHSELSDEDTFNLTITGSTYESQNK